MNATKSKETCAPAERQKAGVLSSNAPCRSKYKCAYASRSVALPSDAHFFDMFLQFVRRRDVYVWRLRSPCVYIAPSCDTVCHSRIAPLLFVTLSTVSFAVVECGSIWFSRRGVVLVHCDVIATNIAHARMLLGTLPCRFRLFSFRDPRWSSSVRGGQKTTKQMSCRNATGRQLVVKSM